MPNKCSGCSAAIDANLEKCPYCGTIQEDNSDEALLYELMNLKRKYEIALAHNNKIALNAVLADEFVLRFVDGEEAISNKNDIVTGDWSDKSFFSYSISSEELLARTANTATLACVDSICRHYEPGIVYPTGEAIYYYRTKADFVRHGRYWQFSSMYSVAIDENGKEF